MALFKSSKKDAPPTVIEPGPVSSPTTATQSPTIDPTSKELGLHDASESGAEHGLPNAMPGDTSAKSDGRINGRSKAKIAVIMAALMMAVFLAALDVSIISTALPTISEDFHSSAGYTWIGSAFLLANAASIPLWGKISDIFGRKPMLLLANIIFMVGSLVSALAHSIGMLIAARAVQGLGGGGLIILVNIVIGDLFPLNIRGAFYGLIGATWAIAGAIGPLIGGAFTQYVTWRWCFYINLPLDGLAFGIILFFLDLKTPRTPLLQGLKAIDWVGALLIVGGTLLFLFGIQYGGVTAPWDSAEVICLIVFGVAMWIAFGFWEWRGAKYPILPMGILSSGTNLATLLCAFFHGCVFIAAPYYLPLYFQAVRGKDPIQSGVDLLPTALSIAVGSVSTGFVVAKFGKFLPPIYIGFTLMVVGLGLFIDFDASSSWGKLIGFQVVSGLGVGPLFQAPIIALQAHIHPRDIATGTSMLGFIRQLATSISVVIGSTVFQNAMAAKAASLQSVLSPPLAAQLTSGNIGANTMVIDQLPPAQRSVVRVDFANSLSTMWIVYTCLAAGGFFCMFFIKRKVLTKVHEETQTGLEAERINADARAAERLAKRTAKRNPTQSPGAGSGVVSVDEDVDRDIEKAIANA